MFQKGDYRPTTHPYINNDDMLLFVCPLGGSPLTQIIWPWSTHCLSHTFTCLTFPSFTDIKFIPFIFLFHPSVQAFLTCFFLRTTCISFWLIVNFSGRKTPPLPSTSQSLLCICLLIAIWWFGQVQRTEYIDSFWSEYYKTWKSFR